MAEVGSTSAAGSSPQLKASIGRSFQAVDVSNHPLSLISYIPLVMMSIYRIFVFHEILILKLTPPDTMVKWLSWIVPIIKESSRWLWLWHKQDQNKPEFTNSLSFPTILYYFFSLIHCHYLPSMTETWNQFKPNPAFCLQNQRISDADQRQSWVLDWGRSLFFHIIFFLFYNFYYKHANLNYWSKMVVSNLLSLL